MNVLDAGVAVSKALRSRAAAGVLALAVPALLAAGCGSTKHAATRTTTTEAKPAAAEGGGSGLRGMIPQPLPVKPSFTLTDTAGRSYDFGAATRGKLTYLFFGYTHCPDACPATMSYLAYAIHEQPAAVRKHIAVVFVTVDPRRDTGPVIRTWLDHYNRSFVGLTGSAPQIARVESEAGIPATAAPGSPKASYQVVHSTFLFAYSPDDHAHVIYAQGFKPGDYAHDMPLLLKFRG